MDFSGFFYLLLAWLTSSPHPAAPAPRPYPLHPAPARPAGPAHLPPPNPYLADSPWPVQHQGPYQQASTARRGPEAGERLLAQAARSPNRQSSPWLYWSEKYPDGRRAVWGSTPTAVYKALADGPGGTLRLVATYDGVNRRRFNFAPMNFCLLKGNQLLTHNGRTLYVLADQDPRNPASPIKLVRSYAVPADRLPGKVGKMGVLYDGNLALQTDEGTVGVLSPDLKLLTTLRLPLDQGEVAHHNNFAWDETGGIYIVTTKRMLGLRWNGQQLTLAWQAPYDFVGDGPTSRLALRGPSIAGSGTTPTLLGTAQDPDQLVAVVDGHNQGSMVLFWRGAVPANWAGLPGLDRRVAAVTRLPYARYLGIGNRLVDYQAVENSPCALGYDIACAQYNGFRQACDPAPGVQKLRWDPSTRQLRVMWATDQLNLNNVLTVSQGSGLVYGSGRRGCTYYFRGLDWETGQVKFELPLGNDALYNDQGCGVQIGDDRRLVFATAEGLVQVGPAAP